MVRTLFQTAFFFAAPFVLYVGYLVVRQRYPFEVAAWTRTTVSVLSIVGLLMAAAAIFGFALLSEQHTGAYTPARWENGTYIPAQVK